MEALLIILGGVALVLGAFLYATFSYGYVLFKFWYWFVLPVFTTLPAIDYMQAIGLILFLSLFKSHKVTRKWGVGGVPFTEINKAHATALGFVFPWLLLLSGYVLHIIIS